MKPIPRKKWGQHFLSDTNFLHKLVRIINLQPQDSVLEIGPGEGAMTELLASQVKELIGIEIDRDLFEYLKINVRHSNCSFLNRDFLKVELRSLPFSTKPVRVIGNIPYNITSPILFKLMAESTMWQDIHLMVQKEVADRITAQVGSREYGRLTVMLWSKMDVKKKVYAPPEVFIPKPKVSSVFIFLKPHNRYPMDQKKWDLFSKVVKAAFSQRRKMIKNSLREFNFSETAKSQIDFSRRPQTLTVEEFLLLVRDISIVNCK